MLKEQMLELINLLGEVINGNITNTYLLGMSQETRLEYLNSLIKRANTKFTNEDLQLLAKLGI